MEVDVINRPKNANQKTNPQKLKSFWEKIGGNW